MAPGCSASKNRSRSTVCRCSQLPQGPNGIVTNRPRLATDEVALQGEDQGEEKGSCPAENHDAWSTFFRVVRAGIGFRCGIAPGLILRVVGEVRRIFCEIVFASGILFENPLDSAGTRSDALADLPELFCNGLEISGFSGYSSLNVVFWVPENSVPV